MQFSQGHITLSDIISNKNTSIILFECPLYNTETKSTEYPEAVNERHVPN